MALCLISISISFVEKNSLLPPTEVRSASLFPDRISLLRRVNLPSRVSLLKQLPPPYIPPPNQPELPDCGDYESYEDFMDDWDGYMPDDSDAEDYWEDW